MAVTVAGKNYVQISSCDSGTADGTWAISAAIDTGNKKEGSGSCSFNMRQTAVTNYITLSSTVDMTSSTHLRCWFLDTTAGVYNLTTDTLAGLMIGVADSSGTNIAYWKMLGRDNYEGGWINLVIDTSSTPDSGTKPTMSAVGRIYFQTNKSVSGKNTENVWIDNICLADGLVAYGDDSGGYFDFDDIYAADNATTLGIGILRKISGQYFSAGSLEIGDSAGTSATKFQATSQILVFEDRRVNTSLYGIDIVDNGTGTTEFILGDKSGSAGIQGCTIRVANSSQTPKFYLDGSTDTDVDNFKLYASSFYGAGNITFPSAATNVEVIGCSFELCAQLIVDDCPISGCFFINTSDADAALLWNESIDISDCSFIGNTAGAGIEHPSAAGSPYTYTNLLFSGNTYDGLNTSGSNITVNLGGTSNASTDEGANTITYVSSSTLTLTGLVTGSEVRIYTTGTTTELDGEDAITGTTFSFSYSGTPSIDIRIHKIGYVYYSEINYTCSSLDVSRPIQQTEDLWYYDPA